MKLMTLAWIACVGRQGAAWVSPFASKTPLSSIQPLALDTSLRRSGVVRTSILYKSMTTTTTTARPSVATDSTNSVANLIPNDNDDNNDEIEPEADKDTSIYTLQAEALQNLKSTFLKTMRDRGFLHQCTNVVELDAQLASSTSENDSNTHAVQSAYLGFDATADSLHVGSLLQIMILRHLQQSGHRPIVLIGGGTSKVGDPTGKDTSRMLLTEERIQENTQGISRVFERFLRFGNETPSDAIMVNNDDWLSELKYLEFLREYGTHFTINRMLSFESVKQRLAREAPFSFLEFNYMILQAYDFLELYRRHNAILQLGGSDQWGNMVSGTELGRRVEGAQLFALTAPLITTSDGKKMGKTANGAVWLNADKLSEYDYWQFWRNTADDDVIRFLKLFTELPLERIAELEKLEGADINQAKIILADEATTLLHGPECLPAIRETIENMFSGAGGVSTEGLPTVTLTMADLKDDGVRLVDLIVQLKLASSKKEARRLIQGGGARLDEEKITDENAVLTSESFAQSSKVVLRAGKKRAGVVELQQ
jgi:tyrosyl-tRNA synthetase